MHFPGIRSSAIFSPVLLCRAMGLKLAFVHTSHVLIPLFSQLSKEKLPGVEVFHMVDESLIRNTIAARHLTKTTIRRLVSTIGSAHEGGADAVMVTCSSIGPGVAVARSQFDFPVLRVDEAMAEKAVNLGRRIGVVATLNTTLEPTIALLEETAAAAGRDVELIPELCDGAFEAVLAGDTARHDELLSGALKKLKEQVEVVVLAQASMARVAGQFQSNGGSPILSSPELAMMRAQSILSTWFAARV
jgi:Asp/Glu/hydantoin racemase